MPWGGCQPGWPGQVVRAGVLCPGQGEHVLCVGPEQKGGTNVGKPWVSNQALATCVAVWLPGPLLGTVVNVPLS